MQRPDGALIRFIREADILEYYQVTDRVSACFNHLRNGAGFHLLLKLLIGLTHNNYVDIVHVILIHIFLPQFMTDGLTYVLLFKVGYFCISFGTLSSSASHDNRHLRVREGHQCLGYHVIFLYVSTRYLSSSFIVLVKFKIILVQNWRLSLLDHCTDPWSWYFLQTPHLRSCSVSSFTHTYSAWMPVPWFSQLIPLTNDLQGIGIVYFLPPPYPFNTLMLNSQVMCRNISSYLYEWNP